jgi:hypothetical protein
MQRDSGAQIYGSLQFDVIDKNQFMLDILFNLPELHSDYNTFKYHRYQRVTFLKQGRWHPGSFPLSAFVIACYYHE